MRKLLGMLGIGLFAGTVFYLFMSKKKTDVDMVSKMNSEDNLDDGVLEKDKTDDYKEPLEFESIKISSLNRMSENHEEATDIMKDAVATILKNTEISKDENKDLDEIAQGLDELLSEE